MEGTMTSRTQYLLFLFIWLTAICVVFFVALAVGMPIEARGLRGDLFIAGVIALAPAAGGYLIVPKTGSVLDAWRLRPWALPKKSSASKMSGLLLGARTSPSALSAQREF